MQLIVGMQHWTYHRAYWYQWGQYLHDYLNRVIALSEKYEFRPMGLDIVADHLALQEPSYVVDVRRKLEAHNLVPVFGLGPIQVHADKEMRERSLKATSDNLRYADMLGARVAMFNAAFHGRVTREGHLDIYSDMVGQLAEKAKPYGVKICNENYDHFTSQDILTVMESCQHPNLGVLNDFGNWLITGDDPVKATRRLRQYTIHTHVKDYVIENNTYRSVPFGQGVIDIPLLVKELHDTPGEGYLQLAMEVDLDEGDEDTAIDLCAAYMHDLLPRL